MKDGCEGEADAGGVWPGWILRMKFMGALGLASAREKRPAVEVAEGGKGCCGYTFVRTGAVAEEGRAGT